MEEVAIMLEPWLPLLAVAAVAVVVVLACFVVLQFVRPD